MRMAFITQDFPPETGGIQTYSFEIARHLSQLCDYFVLIAPAKNKQEQVDQVLPFEVIRIPTSNTLLGFSLFRKLNRIVQEKKIDQTFHAQWQTAMPALRLRSKGLLKKVSIAAHGRELLFNPMGKVPLLGSAYTKYQSSVLKLVDQVFPVSSFTANLLRKQAVAEQRIHVIPNGTNPDFFTPTSTRGLRSTLKLKDKKIAFTVCRHVRRKGIQDVLKAIPEILKQIPNFHYLIGGTGPMTEELKAVATEYQLDKSVTFCGRIPDDQLNDYYSLCDVFIMTPRETFPDVEGFGIVFLEANACAKPVIGARSGGVTDAVQHEKTGLLVEPESSSEIANAIIDLMQNEPKRLQLGQKGMQWVRTEMNWKSTTGRLYECLL